MWEMRARKVTPREWRWIHLIIGDRTIPGRSNKQRTNTLSLTLCPFFPECTRMQVSVMCLRAKQHMNSLPLILSPRATHPNIYYSTSGAIDRSKHPSRGAHVKKPNGPSGGVKTVRTGTSTVYLNVARHDTGTGTARKWDGHGTAQTATAQA